jgi:hypothetical protein
LNNYWELGTPYTYGGKSPRILFARFWVCGVPTHPKQRESHDFSASVTCRGYFRLVLDEAAELDIDAFEDGLLRRCYPALRDALAQRLERAIKKALAQQDQCGAGRRLRRHAGDYRIDGEVGRLCASGERA